MLVIKATGSGDVGNSSTKAILRFAELVKARKQPTVMSYLPVVPKFEDDDLETLVANLHKNMVVHVTSNGISRNGLFAVGDLANVHDGNGFNIRHHKKSEQDLSIIQPLSMIAVMAIQNIYNQSSELPSSFEINLKYTTAIPVVDYSKADAKALENRLIGNHVLIVYVGEGHRVSVSINVTDAKVLQEGIPAFYSVVTGSPEVFKKYNERYETNLDGKSFVNKKMLFVDIGDGTEELIFVENGKPIATKSKGYRLGVGHASEKAILAFKSHFNFRAELTRTTFMDKVLNAHDKWHNEALNELNDALFEQEQKILDSIVDTIENTLMNDVDVIVVFGGGTNVFGNLENKLIKYASQYKITVLWIDGKIASLLNAYGLDELNTKSFFKQKQKR